MSVEKETKGEPTWWQSRLRCDIRCSSWMLEAMKSFMIAFMVRQEVGSIQWPTKSSDSSEGEDNEREVEPTKGNKKVEAAEDEALEGRETMPRDETMEDDAISTGPMSKGVDPREQSMPL
ncbi:hypothetical protein GOBAR_AA26246 [Gossypium barbadense]|uniref:Uncharacterized protein n=1 Tax=Gossypium barbadense TaxID=3634 RepID=A0A2P5WTJ9_GOSBA|nr:hypothetical protein GOBAR_AA26246 [Gossypium barbadense]